jgi:hypothetical protein
VTINDTLNMVMSGQSPGFIIRSLIIKERNEHVASTLNCREVCWQIAIFLFLFFKKLLLYSSSDWPMLNQKLNGN